LDLTDHNRLCGDSSAKGTDRTSGEAAQASASASFFGFLPGACIVSAKIAKALEALSRQIVSLFSPDCPGKSTKSAFLLPNGVGASDPERLVC
jgi:hypothetical protein